jgi:hypothetical protein
MEQAGAVMAERMRQEHPHPSLVRGGGKGRHAVECSSNELPTTLRSGVNQHRSMETASKSWTHPPHATPLAAILQSHGILHRTSLLLLGRLDHARTRCACCNLATSAHTTATGGAAGAAGATTSTAAAAVKQQRLHKQLPGLSSSAITRLRCRRQLPLLLDALAAALCRCQGARQPRVVLPRPGFLLLQLRRNPELLHQLVGTCMRCVCCEWVWLCGGCV